ncbi:MAG TPA: discoidin domain-containing protein [Bryobacteraceae bacterium]|nr:discoidin domain-containing protein [Bryobacteraceae bacterium]
MGSLSTVFSLTNQPGGGSNDLALGKTATQSSTLPGYASASAVAASAVDGNPDGNFFDGSVTATSLDPNPWWQVDLGASASVSSVVVWNRTDCCVSRLNDYWVFISDTPFLPTDTFGQSPALFASLIGKLCFQRFTGAMVICT